MFQIENYGKLPLNFEFNQGQTDPQVKYMARGRGYYLFLTSKEAVLVLRRPGSKKSTADQLTKKIMSQAEQLAEKETPPAEQQKVSVMRMSLAGANSQPLVEELEELPGKANYFIGNDPAKWHTNIPTYARIKYRDVYPGVDMVYYGNQGQLEWDFVVSPGADPAAIALDFQGIEKLEADGRGNLVLHTSGEEIQLRKPFIYQEVDGARREIPSSYVVKDRNRAGFQLGEYDAARTLVIDPVLVYSTYLGGSGNDRGNSIAVDIFDNAYVTGFTNSLNFPTQNPLQPDFGGGDFDAFVTKIDASGSALVYSTYLGGSGSDIGLA